MEKAEARRIAKIRKQFDLLPVERRTRFRRRLLVSGAVLIPLAVAAYFLGPRVAGNVERWHARRYANEALALIDAGSWHEAAAKARDAYQFNPREPQASRAIARLLSRQGDSRGSLRWWASLEAMGVLSPEDRRDYAGAALTADELLIAKNQIDQLLEESGPLAPPIELLLSAQLNLRRMASDAALAQAGQVLSDPRSVSRELLSAAILILGITPQESPDYARAWSQLDVLGQRTDDPLSLDALCVMAQQPPPSTPVLPETTAFSDLRSPPRPLVDARSEDEIAAALETHPRAQRPHKLLALQLRIRDHPTRAAELIPIAFAQFSVRDDDSFHAFVGWLNAHGYADQLLKLLTPERASQRRDLFQQYVEAMALTQRWLELKELLGSERFPIEPVVQYVYLAKARAHLSEITGAANEWQRALENAGTPEKSLWIADQARREHADDAADAAYQLAIASEPKLRAAYIGRLQLARARGQTNNARAIAGEIARIWPDDPQAQLEALYLRLLTTPSEIPLEGVEQASEQAVKEKPADWDARKTLALARLRSGKAASALQAFSRMRATGTEPPGALAVRAAVLAANGWIDGARGDARNLGAADLLPEERALIATLF